METEVKEIKLIAGNFKIPCRLEIKGSRIFCHFPYSKDLLTEIKQMEGAKWHGFDEKNPIKAWSISNSQRNWFQLSYLQGLNPYQPYDQDLPNRQIPARFNKIKNMYCEYLKHQVTMTWHMFLRPGSIVAGEMGTGKTLANITAAEMLHAKMIQEGKEPGEFWYVAPRAPIKAIERELFGWGCTVPWKMMTYEELTKRAKNWESGMKAPQMITFDESSKIKTPTSQRSQAAKQFADGVRGDWGDLGRVILMTGTPAPKSPADWYWQAEIACPGFLKEGDINKFKNRLGIIVMKESIVGAGVYPQLVTWRDSEDKCNKCGQLSSHSIHQMELADPESHPWEKSVNEVGYLYERLKGLVVVFFKKDCIDLPEKNYRIIEVKPNQSTLRAAKIITKAAKTTIEGLTRLRELSDGFQYTEVPLGKETCPRCNGSKVATEYEEVPGTCPTCKNGIPTVGWIARDEYDKPICPDHQPERTPVEVSCPHCGGFGEVTKFERSVKEVVGPKDQVVKDLLDEHEDIGRIVIFAGFTASIDRVVRICHSQDWHTIRVDQGKWVVQNPKGEVLPIKDQLSMFQQWKDEYPRVAFVGHPGSAGMSLTLTASPSILYFSNDFNGENRSQSEDRIHRIGMDTNRGATIIDIIHLPSDRKVLDNLKMKRNLELMSLGDVASALDKAEHSEERAH